MPTLCQHCQTSLSNRPRNLCHRCYEHRSIRELYSRRTRKHFGHRIRQRKLAAEPTAALPGSPAKLRVFRQRFRLRVQLFHPDDA